MSSYVDITPVKTTPWCQIKRCAVAQVELCYTLKTPGQSSTRIEQGSSVKPNEDAWPNRRRARWRTPQRTVVVHVEHVEEVSCRSLHRAFDKLATPYGLHDDTQEHTGKGNFGAGRLEV